MKMRASTFVRYWMPVLAWMLIIFGASTDLGSAAQTSRFLIPFLHWIHPSISFATIETIHLFLRKGAHLTEYGILALLLLRAVRSETRKAFVFSALSVLLVAGLYAATDEFHQSFVQSRTASPWDVMIDCGGTLIGIGIFWIFAHLKNADARTRGLNFSERLSHGGVVQSRPRRKWWA